MAPNTDLPTRALVVAWKCPSGGKSTQEIMDLTGLPKSTVNDIYKRAIDRGFDPTARPVIIKMEYLIDAPRSGRPSKVKDEETQRLVADKVRKDRYGREKSCATLAGDLGELGVNISASSIRRILKSMGFRKTKPTRKPGLTRKMRMERKQWCLEHQDWTLEDWKNVIWTDETSVVLGHRRGGYRIWRTSKEALVKSCIRERWKGYSEFMFWGAFSYDKKGPYYCWRKETAAEKKKALKEIEEMNKELEPELRAQWELLTSMNRLGLRSKPGRKPQWQWDKAHGRLQRGRGSGIDWYRYQTKVLKPLLIPFAQECMKDRPGTVVQEDKAPSHAAAIQARVYDFAKVRRMLWCGNSPDLNAIEPCWWWMKRHTTKKGAASSRAEAERRWIKAWVEDLQQKQIQAWIERIPHHIQQIIDLDGGNEYKEGRTHTQRDHGTARTRNLVAEEATAAEAAEATEWESASEESSPSEDESESEWEDYD